MLFRRFFRKRRLNRDASQVGTGIMPLDAIKSVTVLIDSGEPDFEECSDAVRAFFRKNGLNPALAYADFRKFNRSIRPSTDNTETIFRRSLNWFGKPSAKKTPAALSSPCDLFICLSGSDRFCIEYVSAAIPAKFKIGRTEFAGEPYDMVFSVPRGEADAVDGRKDDGAAEKQAGQTEIFSIIAGFLEKIK